MAMSGGGHPRSVNRPCLTRILLCSNSHWSSSPWHSSRPRPTRSRCRSRAPSSNGSCKPAADVAVWLAEALDRDEGRRFGMEMWWSSLSKPAEGSTPVLVHSRTDAAGRFTIEVPAEAVARRSPPPMAIWASTTGKEPRVAWHRLPRIVLADDPPVRIELGAPVRTSVIVRGPDRQPVAGAYVVPIRADEIPVPEPLGLALAATTDARGRAIVVGFSPSTLDAARVEAPDSGSSRSDSSLPTRGFPNPGFPVSGCLGASINRSPSPWPRPVGSRDAWFRRATSRSRA